MKVELKEGMVIAFTFIDDINDQPLSYEFGHKIYQALIKKVLNMRL